MSAERVDVYSTPGFIKATTVFSVGDEVRVPQVPHWPKGKVLSVNDNGRPHICWDNGFVDVFNWLDLEKV
jgi:hypothetical protein